MKRPLILCMFVLISMVMISCSSNVDTIKQVEQTIPEWYLNPPQVNDLFVYATASGYSVDIASKNAKSKISEYYRSYIESEYLEAIHSSINNDKENLEQYVSSKISLLSNLEIPGITISKAKEVNGLFYVLAVMDRDVFEQRQNDIRNKMIALVKDADIAKDIGNKLSTYYLSASLLPKLLTPTIYNDQLMYAYLKKQINKIVSAINVNYTFDKYSQVSDYEALVITIKSDGKCLKGIPFLIDGQSNYSDQAGKFYLQNDEQEPFDIIVKIDLDNINLSSELQGKEIQQAKEIINLMTSFEQNLHIIPPVEYKAYIKVNSYIDQLSSNNSQLENMIKQYFLTKNTKITDDKDNANLVIEVSTYAEESSYNNYLGYAYKAGGEVTIANAKNEISLIDLNDEGTREKTKSFNQKKNIAASSAIKELNKIIINRIKEIQIK